MKKGFAFLLALVLAAGAAVPAFAAGEAPVALTLGVGDYFSVKQYARDNGYVESYQRWSGSDYRVIGAAQAGNSKADKSLHIVAFKEGKASFDLYLLRPGAGINDETTVPFEITVVANPNYSEQNITVTDGGELLVKDLLAPLGYTIADVFDIRTSGHYEHLGSGGLVFDEYNAGTDKWALHIVGPVKGDPAFFWLKLKDGKCFRYNVTIEKRSLGAQIFNGIHAAVMSLLVFPFFPFLVPVFGWPFFWVTPLLLPISIFMLPIMGVLDLINKIFHII